MLKWNAKYDRKVQKMLFWGVLCLFGVCMAQVRPMRKHRTTPVKNPTKVFLLHADELSYNQILKPDAQLLKGKVHFRQDNVHMYCDSAYYYEKSNSFEAYKNVKMQQGDTLFLYGDYLHYDGNTQMAFVRMNVKLINRKTVLTTDSLNYDRLYNIGYFIEGGTLTDEQNVLTSDWGEYSPSTKVAVFNYNVKLVNPKFTLTSDTLRYSTATKTANIVGPSNIDSKENHIYSESGFYNTDKEQGILLNRSVWTNGEKRMVGDSLYYDRKKGYGEGFRNVILSDKKNKNMLTGDYCYYNEKTGYALATKKAVVIDYSQPDSAYLHADSLKMFTYNINTDSVYRKMLAYRKVRMYKKDVQAVCDSMSYNTKDSCLTMYYNPILWNQGQQLFGEEIRAYANDSTIDWAHIINQATSIEQKDSLHYNQVTGKEMKIYFQKGTVEHTDVIGNVQVVYYPLDEDSTMIGMNTSVTSQLSVFMKDKKVHKMIMKPQSNGTLYPMLQIPKDKMYIPIFAWFDYIRPLNKNDIFEWRGKKAGQELKKTERREVPLQNLDKLKGD